MNRPHWKELWEAVRAGSPFTYRIKNHAAGAVGRLAVPAQIEKSGN
jgi:hypothetical protein